MIQFYFLSIIYITFSGLLLLPDNWKKELSFMIIIRGRLRDTMSLRLLYSIVGFIIGLGTFAFPISPGPAPIGDLIPAVCVIYHSFLNLFLNAEGRSDSYSESLRTGIIERIGKISLIVALIHFLFPSLILL